MPGHSGCPKEAWIRRGSRFPTRREIMRGKGRPIVKYKDSMPWGVQKRLNRSFGMWTLVSVSKESCIRWSVHWRHLATTCTTEPSMCGDDAAFLSNDVDQWLLFHCDYADILHHQQFYNVRDCQWPKEVLKFDTPVKTCIARNVFWFLVYPGQYVLCFPRYDIYSNRWRDLQGHSRSLILAPFARTRVIPGSWFIVTMCLSRAVNLRHIHHLFPFRTF